MKEQDVDRAVFMAIRNKVVEAGYYPDIRLVGSNGLQAAKDAIIASGKELIQPASNSSQSDKGAEKLNRIVVTRTGDDNGSIGGFGATASVVNGLQGTLTALPIRYKDLTYTVKVLASSVAYQLICKELVMKAVQSEYISTVDANGDSLQENGIHILYNGCVDVPFPDAIETTIRLTAPDVELVYGTPETEIQSILTNVEMILE